MESHIILLYQVTEYSNYTRIEDKTSPTTKFSEIKRDEPFANTWLLTGITGSDFVDRGGAGNAPNGVIDENDWGYWVKFNYGKYSDDYQWSIPFSGVVVDASNTSQSKSNGHKQLFYLNSIETRTHVALFVKDSRLDNRGLNSTSTLRLSEIDLITREAYQKLFLPVAQGGFAISTDIGLANIGKLWMMSDFFSVTGTNHPLQGNFLIQNALKRVKFGHTYDLCSGAPNSNASNGGKLTLTRVALLGRNDAKTVPDYKFEYSNNPGYDANKWDGWGMYSSTATSAYNSHQASNIDVDGSAWSLTKITNPLGSTIDVTYERDTYSSISGMNPYSGGITSIFKADAIYRIYSGYSTIPINNSGFKLKSGDGVFINGSAYYTCSNGNPVRHIIPLTKSTILSSTETSLTFASPIGACSSSECNCSTNTSTELTFEMNVYQGATKGGNIRVSSLLLKDDGKEYKSRYLFNDQDGFSNGVVAREPDYVKFQDFDFYNLPGYPFTPVMYSKVTVLTGKLATDADYHTKQVYEFETPDQFMIINSGTSDFNFTKITSKNSFPFNYHAYYKAIRNQISDYTSKIGKLKSVKLYDQSSTLPISNSDMVYSNQIVNRNPSTNLIENNYQGVYSEGTLMFDRIFEGGAAISDYNKMSRTTLLKYPHELVKVINTKDGFSSETENKAWDFTSGLVVEKTEKSPLGLRRTTVTKPAFRVPGYSQMGSKALDINNKNMLGHEAANYTYQTDAAGNNIGLLSASVQTWKSDWSNYRYFNGTNYVEDADGSPSVWRKYQNYVYKGTYADLRADGSLTFSSAKQFDFSAGAVNTGWQKTGEVTRYDHYSAALEGKDLNNIFTSSKKDIAARQVYANASNANYYEFAYSGAEDWDASGTGLYLGGEVSKGAATKVTKTLAGTETHTGLVAVQLAAGAKAFAYKPASLTNNRVYRVSAWTNSLAGAVYYSLNGGAEQTILPVSTMKVGNWYQINAEIPVGTFSSLEVGVKSTSGTVSFDDFRFQPRDGSLTANVYDPVTGAVTFVLDNQNMFTQYEYNDRGQLIKTYSESFMYGVKLVSENKINYKRFNTNQ